MEPRCRKSAKRCAKPELVAAERWKTAPVAFEYPCDTWMVSNGRIGQSSHRRCIRAFLRTYASFLGLEQMGDNAFRNRSRDLDIILRSIIRQHSGIPIEGKLLGDGVLSVFTSGRDALAAALACAVAGANAALPLHVGVHAGDIIRERDNVYGTAVNIAARISSASAPGEVLVADVVRSLARRSAGVEFEYRASTHSRAARSRCGCSPCGRKKRKRLRLDARADTQVRPYPRHARSRDHMGRTIRAAL